MKRALAALTMVVFVAALLTLVFAPRPAAAADDERMARMMKMMEQMNGERRWSLPELKDAIKRQAWAIAFDERRAIAALPKLAPDMEQRRRGVDAARTVMGARGDLTPEQQERFRRVEEILELYEGVLEGAPS